MGPLTVNWGQELIASEIHPLSTPFPVLDCCHVGTLPRDFTGAGCHFICMDISPKYCSQSPKQPIVYSIWFS